MQTRTFRVSSLVFLVLCALPVTLTTGCSGGGSTTFVSSNSVNAFVGNYTGTYRVTQGPDANEVSTFALRVNSDGTATGSVTDVRNNTAQVSGNVNTTTGAFLVSGIFDITGTSGEATGTITNSNGVVSGSGTFELTNGNRGTVTLQKS